MLRSTRFGIVAALAVVFAAAPTARAADVEKLLPNDSEFVFHVNLKQIIDSEIIKKYALEQLKQALQGNDAQEALRELGLDPLKDLDSITAGGSGTDANDAKGLIVVRGKFNADKLFKAAEAHAKKDGDRFTLIKDGKDTMFKFQPDNGNPVYGTVVDDKTIVIGSDKKTVSTAVAASGEGKAAAVNKDLAALISKMDSKASLWLCGVTKGKLDKLPIPPGGGNANIQGQIAKLDNVSLVIRVTGDVNLDVSLGMATEDAADEMGKTVDEGLQTVKGALPFLAANDDRLKPLVDVAKTLKSEVKGKAVTITAKLTGAAIGKLINPGD